MNLFNNSVEFLFQLFNIFFLSGRDVHGFRVLF